MNNKFGHYTTCLTIPGHNNVAGFIQNICGYNKRFVDELYRVRSDALLLKQVTDAMRDRLTLEIKNSKMGNTDTFILNWPDGKSITINDGTNVVDIRVPTTLAKIWKAIQTSNVVDIKKYISEAPLEVTDSRKKSTVEFYKSLQQIKSRIETNMSPTKPSPDIRKAPV